MTTMQSGPPEIEDRSQMRLHRSASDRVCCGVCGGIAEYLALDPSLVRIAFVIATLWGGIGLLLYVVLAIILPVDVDWPQSNTPRSPERSHILGGLVLIVLGSLLLASNMGFAPWLNWNLFWPTILILIGVAVLVRQPRGQEV